jgi:hypothetical protein
MPCTIPRKSMRTPGDNLVSLQVLLTVDGKPINPVSLKALRLDDNQRGATAAEGFR